MYSMTPRLHRSTDGRGEHPEEARGGPLRVAAVGHDVIQEVSPLHELHHEEEVRIRLKPLVEADDAGVLKAGQHLRLGAELQVRSAACLE